MSDQSHSEGTHGVPRLIYNSDGDSTTFITFPPPMTPEQACRDVDEVADTAVEVFTNSMGRGDETFSHRSEFAEVYGSNVTEWPEGEGLEWVKWMADSTKALLDQGIDIVELLAARAHERGLQFWPALRMNDIHEDDTERFGAFRSTFKKEHPELLIGSPYPTVAGYGYDQDDFTWAFDFARPEVRERKLGLILETCERYDIDGFEMDFQRGRWFFKQGQEASGMPLMTDFMRKVRAETAEIMRRKGRPFTLMLRVPSTREGCRRIGLDVPTWIREELADLFIPMDGGYLNMGSEIAAFNGDRRRHLVPDRRRPGAAGQGIRLRRQRHAVRGRIELLAPGGELHLPVQLRLPSAAARHRVVYARRGPAPARDPRPAPDRAQEQALHRERGHAPQDPGAARRAAASLRAGCRGAEPVVHPARGRRCGDGPARPGAGGHVAAGHLRGERPGRNGLGVAEWPGVSTAAVAWSCPPPRP